MERKESKVFKNPQLTTLKLSCKVSLVNRDYGKLIPLILSSMYFCSVLF